MAAPMVVAPSRGACPVPAGWRRPGRGVSTLTLPQNGDRARSGRRRLPGNGRSRARSEGEGGRLNSICTTGLGSVWRRRAVAAGSPIPVDASWPCPTWNLASTPSEPAVSQLSTDTFTSASSQPASALPPPPHTPYPHTIHATRPPLSPLARPPRRPPTSPLRSPSVPP